MRLHAVGDILVFDVLARERQRIFADVGKIDAPVRIVHGHRDADAARSGAEIEHARDVAIVEPRRKTLLDHLGDRRSRHQSARVGFELESGEPRRAGQIGHRLVLVDAPIDELEHALLFRSDQSRLAVGRREVVRKMQRMQHEMRRFVDRVVVAVAEREPGRAKAARAVADEVDDRGELRGHATASFRRAAEYRCRHAFMRVLARALIDSGQLLAAAIAHARAAIIATCIPGVVPAASRRIL